MIIALSMGIQVQRSSCTMLLHACDVFVVIIIGGDNFTHSNNLIAILMEINTRRSFHRSWLWYLRRVLISDPIPFTQAALEGYLCILLSNFSHPLEIAIFAIAWFSVEFQYTFLPPTQQGKLWNNRSCWKIMSNRWTKTGCGLRVTRMMTKYIIRL